MQVNLAKVCREERRAATLAAKPELASALRRLEPGGEWCATVSVHANIKTGGRTLFDRLPARYALQD